MGITKRLLGCALACSAIFVGSLVLSACGGGGGTPPPSGGTLTGSASVSASVTSRVAPNSIGQLREIQQQVRFGRFGSATTTRSRGRQGLEYDTEMGLYYRVSQNPAGARFEFFSDSGGNQKVGEFAYLERPGSYEIIVSLTNQYELYYKLVETSAPERIRFRSRYIDLTTQERTSYDGELVVASLNDDGWEDEFEWDEDMSWYDDFEWWESDDCYLGDDYFDTDFFADDNYFLWNDDDEFDYTPNFDYFEGYDDIGDFEIVRFEGTIVYEGCGTSLTINNAVLDYTTGQLTGDIQLNNESGSIDYNTETGQGQIVLNTAQGQIRIVFRGDEVEAIYPDGRRERVNLNQWADPCTGVTAASRAVRDASTPRTLNAAPYRRLKASNASADGGALSAQ